MAGMHTLLGIALVLAQASATPAAQAAAQRITAPTITVVAQKEPADPRALPVSVTAVGGDTIRDAGVMSVSEAAAYAPNTFFTEFSARKLSNPRFRAIGASPANPGVTTYIDGVPQLNSNSSSVDLLDVDQIEFVRGPQSALFGRNTLGGVINISSKRPSLSKWGGEVSAPLGNYGARDVRGSLSGPLGDRVALGVSFGYGEREGFTTNTVTGHDVDFRKATSGKGQLLFTPTDNWEARLIVSGERSRDGDYALGDLASIRATPFKVARDFEGHTDRDIFSGTLLTRREGSSFVLSTATGWLRWKTQDVTDLDYTPLSLIRRDNSEEATQFTEEVRLASNAPVKLSDSTNLRWQVGTMFFTQNYDQDAINTFSPFVLSTFINFPVMQHSPTAALDDFGAALYGQGTLVINDKLDVSAGARYDYERKKANLNTFFDPQIAAAVLVNKEKKFTNVSPQFGLSYRTANNHRLYASLGMGFKAGGFNPSSPAGLEAYGDERSWTGEAGFRTMWIHDRVTFDAGAFFTDWDGLQLNLPITGAPGQFYISNVGGAWSGGGEIEMSVRPHDSVEFFGSLGLTRARFIIGTTSGGVLVSEKNIPNTPEHTGTVGLQVLHPLGSGSRLHLFARAEAVFTGAFKYDDANTMGQEAYSLINLRGGLQAKNFSITGWVRNAADTRYVPVAFAYPGLAASGFVGEMGRPRTVGVTLTAKF
jgi:iron complex outermembrane receptor protein